MYNYNLTNQQDSYLIENTPQYCHVSLPLGVLTLETHTVNLEFQISSTTLSIHRTSHRVWNHLTKSYDTRAHIYITP